MLFHEVRCHIERNQRVDTLIDPYGCSLFFTKIMQIERNQACLKLLRCSLFSTKITQIERNQACLKLLRCSLFSTKIT